MTLKILVIVASVNHKSGERKIMKRHFFSLNCGQHTAVRSRILMLSSCEYSLENGRLVIARKIW